MLKITIFTIINITDCRTQTPAEMVYLPAGHTTQTPEEEPPAEDTFCLCLCLSPANLNHSLSLSVSCVSCQ